MKTNLAPRLRWLASAKRRTAMRVGLGARDQQSVFVGGHPLSLYGPRSFAGAMLKTDVWPPRILVRIFTNFQRALPDPSASHRPTIQPGRVSPMKTPYGKTTRWARTLQPNSSLPKTQAVYAIPPHHFNCVAPFKRGTIPLAPFLEGRGNNKEDGLWRHILHASCQRGCTPLDAPLGVRTIPLAPFLDRKGEISKERF